MEAKYIRELQIMPSACDSSGLLGVPDAFSLFVDAATQHAFLLGCGLDVLGPRGLFWLAVRSRVRFYRRPRMLERVTLSTWPERPGKLRADRDYVLEQDGALLAAGKTEWAVLNQETGRLHPMGDVFPADLDFVPDLVWSEPFSRIRDEALPEFARTTVRSTDIDLGGHMNNIAYLRTLAALYACEAWQGLEIRELEITYRAPCFEGETLCWQRREEDNAVSLRAAREDGTTIVLIRIAKG